MLKKTHCFLRRRLRINAYGDGGGRGSGHVHGLNARVDGDGHEVRQEDRLENARAGGARRGSVDVHAPAARGRAGVRAAR